MIHLRKIFAIVLAGLVLSLASCEKDNNDPIVLNIDFQNIELEPENYWNGEDETGSKSFGMATFNTQYTSSEWGGYWEGFAYSNITDTETPGFLNQYSAYVDSNADPKNVYSVAYVNEESATITFNAPVTPRKIFITNSTYAYHTIKNGDDFTQPFADGDWFKLTITGYDNTNSTVDSIDFYLADYRDGKEEIVTGWESVDLTSLTEVSKLVFTLTSSDNGEWGMNTPSYFCLDELVFEYLP